MKILLISDLHAPFQHPEALDFLRDLRNNLKPDRVICLGDEVDMHNFARWPRDPEAIGPNEELTQARKVLSSLAKLFPRLTIVDSNHTWRPWKRAAATGLSAEWLKSRQSILETPDSWQWFQACTCDDVTFIHGEGFAGARAALEAAISWHRPVCIGHIHAHAGVQYQAGPERQVWGLNAGCLIDVKAPAFSYGRTYKHKPVIGTGAVLDGVPYFFPLS